MEDKRNDDRVENMKALIEMLDIVQKDLTGVTRALKELAGRQPPFAGKFIIKGPGRMTAPYCFIVPERVGRRGAAGNPKSSATKPKPPGLATKPTR